MRTRPASERSSQQEAGDHSLFPGWKTWIVRLIQKPPLVLPPSCPRSPHHSRHRPSPPARLRLGRRREAHCAYGLPQYPKYVPEMAVRHRDEGNGFQSARCPIAQHSSHVPSLLLSHLSFLVLLSPRSSLHLLPACLPLHTSPPSRSSQAACNMSGWASEKREIYKPLGNQRTAVDRPRIPRGRRGAKPRRDARQERQAARQAGEDDSMATS